MQSSAVQRRSHTVTPGPRLQPDKRYSAAELRDFGVNTYRQVWQEFYEWEPGYASHVLTDVKNQPLFPVRSRTAQMARSLVKKVADGVPSPALLSESHSEACSVSFTKHTAYGATTAKVMIPTVVLDATQFPPHAPYECCAPASRSILVSEGDRDTAKFLPYADEPSFPAKTHLAKFARLEWEENFDPDLEMIQLETAWRLHAVDKLSLSDLNRMNIVKGIHTSHNSGLLWDSCQRDFLHWPGASQINAKDGLPTSQAPQQDDLHGRLTSMLRIFCPILNCLSPMCHTHAYPFSSYLPSKKPQITGESMRLSEGNPCGENCFRLVPDIERYAESLPPPSEVDQMSLADNLSVILGIAPDLFPCQLATTLLQTFVKRLQLFPDNSILPLDRESSAALSTDGESVPRLDPCAHPGTCTTAACKCYSHKMHCNPACRCGLSCVRQWPPCTCQKCEDHTCSCAMGKRECIPGLCLLEVKTGSYGLGAFAAEGMAVDAFLGTYVGHILSNNAAESTSEILAHNGRNYLFEFSADAEIFDAAQVGNLTRYLNHQGNGMDNVDASSMLVNGEHQIGFFTKRSVNAGEEMFLDYGQNYWIHHGGKKGMRDEDTAEDGTSVQ
ncbi:hypothetical protein BKA82DRAFT_4186253 [Pisolithus tinctorius]|nr:hypothetical protein BKA82DRAFT_4186253 [Pisolithus tinctorius]